MIDAKDVSILNIFLENARLSYREIAKKVKVSVVTVMNRVKKLEKLKVIEGYTVKLDYEKLGYDVQAIISLRISRGKFFEVEEKIATHPNVFIVYDVTGNFDSLIIAKFRSRKGLDKFLKKIQTYDFVERSKTKLILNTIKEEHIGVS
tara:strand:- start:86 stop:529 length:444 start_codon:yes stop_codon:yes gene_type:complete